MLDYILGLASALSLYIGIKIILRAFNDRGIFQYILCLLVFVYGMYVGDIGLPVLVLCFTIVVDVIYHVSERYVLEVIQKGI